MNYLSHRDTLTLVTSRVKHVIVTSMNNLLIYHCDHEAFSDFCCVCGFFFGETAKHNEYEYE